MPLAFLGIDTLQGGIELLEKQGLFVSLVLLLFFISLRVLYKRLEEGLIRHFTQMALISEKLITSEQTLGFMHRAMVHPKHPNNVLPLAELLSEVQESRAGIAALSAQVDGLSKHNLCPLHERFVRDLERISDTLTLFVRDGEASRGKTQQSIEEIQRNLQEYNHDLIALVRTFLQRMGGPPQSG
jgi:hypothetical protein